jgi:Fe-S cluster assembly protein SufD
VAGGTTQQLVKGAVRAGGRGVFQGKIVVDRGAQKTDARQHHQALLLEEGAEAFAKPELIINADDVQCAHGNTIGALDEQALFYMRQRGLPEAEARALLTEAFLLEALPEDLDAGLRDELAGRVSAWLRARA